MHHENWSNGCGNLEIFDFEDECRWPTSIVTKILMADTVLRSQMHHHAKSRQNQSSGCGDTANFRLFK